MTDNTYEATRARQSTLFQPDKITWSESCAYRDSPYRLLHHQKGFIGKFRVRLLEAADLKRSYWSALALGPVKHLGLSKAHGPISSYCSFGLSFPQPQENSTASDLEKKPSAVSKTPGWSPCNSNEVVRSPLVPSNDNPVWPSCEFELPLRKGAMPRDGLRIILQLRVDEDATAAENMIPVGVPSQDERLLGTGELDITSLCLGETDDGITQVGVLDVWIPIELKKNNDSIMQKELMEAGVIIVDDNEKKGQAASDTPPCTGRVRVLVSYTPNGLGPKHNDWVALEAFARRSPRHNGVRPLIPPLLPMRVMDVRGPYLLVEYTLDPRKDKKGTMRIHRNAVFVIERTNMVDGMVNLALAPTDILLSTPIGQRTARMTAPVVSALGELIMPAVLTAKLLLGVVKTTAFAGVSGVSAATHAAMSAAHDANERRQREASFHASNSDVSRQERFV